MNEEQIVGAITAVTKSWTKQRKAEERHASALSRRESALNRSHRITLIEAAARCISEGYLKASSKGTFPAHARQVMYACRGAIQDMAGVQLDDKYFTQTLLPDYMIANPEETSTWDVVFDARGHFTEPHTGKIIPLGTLDVRQYLKNIDENEVEDLSSELIDTDFPTMGPTGTAPSSSLRKRVSCRYSKRCTSRRISILPS